MVNKIFLIGHLGADPELSYTQSGVAVARARMATTERWKTQDGDREQTEWHNLVFWRHSAEVANKYLRKGSKIFVEGRIKYRSWDGQDGQKRYATDIEVRNLTMLGEGGNRAESSPRTQQQQTAQQPEPQTTNDYYSAYDSGNDFTGGNDDLPF